MEDIYQNERITKTERYAVDDEGNRLFRLECHFPETWVDKIKTIKRHDVEIALLSTTPMYDRILDDEGNVVEPAEYAYSIKAIKSRFTLSHLVSFVDKIESYSKIGDEELEEINRKTQQELSELNARYEAAISELLEKITESKEDILKFADLDDELEEEINKIDVDGED